MGRKSKKWTRLDDLRLILHQMSPYEAWFALIGGLVILAPAYQGLVRGEADIHTVGGGRRARTQIGSSSENGLGGAVAATVSVTLLGFGISGLLKKSS